MFILLKQENAARRGRFITPHGVIETPVFMNVGTSAAIKGAVKGDLSNYLYKHTKRNPMILPVIMEI